MLFPASINNFRKRWKLNFFREHSQHSIPHNLVMSYQLVNCRFHTVEIFGIPNRLNPLTFKSSGLK